MIVSSHAPDPCKVENWWLLSAHPLPFTMKDHLNCGAFCCLLDLRICPILGVPMTRHVDTPYVFERQYNWLVTSTIVVCSSGEYLARGLISLHKISKPTATDLFVGPKSEGHIDYWCEALHVDGWYVLVPSIGGFHARTLRTQFDLCVMISLCTSNSLGYKWAKERRINNRSDRTEIVHTSSHKDGGSFCSQAREV